MYVDDLFIDGRNTENVEKFHTQLAKTFPVRTLHILTPENPIDFLGIIISTTPTHVTMDMEAYCNDFVDIIENYFGTLTPASTPICTSIPDDSPYLVDEVLIKLCRTGIGCLGWMSNTVRPDLSYTHSRLSQHMAKPNQGVLAGLKQAARYVKGHTTLGLAAPKSTPSNQFLFFTDSDHAGNREAQNHCKSQLGWLSLINGCPDLWKSTVVSLTQCSSLIKEQPPQMSVGEAEVYAATNGIMDFMRLSYVVSEMGIRDFPMPMTILMDSTVAESFMKNTCTKSRMKHIDVRQSWVQIIRNNSIAQPAHIDSSSNLADMFTKILPRVSFVKNRDAIMKCIKLLRAGIVKEPKK